MIALELTEGLLERRVAKILPDKAALSKLLDERKIRLYQGFDPTGGRLHLGHSIGLLKLMDFAEAGHEVIFLFGTGTVLVGDPSLRDSARKLITPEEIAENIKHWQDQTAPIVDWSKVSVKENGEWLTKLGLADIIKIASQISSVQLFKRDSFTRRIERGDTVWYHETMYPLLQGYDSVVMDVDLEVGGTDQEFNMLMGRELQKKMANREKFVLETPMILGTDGQQMSKSSGNCVWLDDPAPEMFGKLMRVPDDQIIEYAWLCSRMSVDEVRDLQAKLEGGENPRQVKEAMALAIVGLYHGDEAAQAAAQGFTAQFTDNQLPEDIAEVSLDKAEWDVPELLEQAELVASRSEARRLLEQGGLRLNQEKLTEATVTLKTGDILQAGKRRFVRVTMK